MILAPDGTGEILARRRTLASANARCQHKDAWRNTYGCDHAPVPEISIGVLRRGTTVARRPREEALMYRCKDPGTWTEALWQCSLKKNNNNNPQNTLVPNQNSRCIAQTQPSKTYTLDVFSVWWRLEPGWTFPNFLPSFTKHLTNHFSVSDGSWLTTLSLSVSPPFLSLMPACLHSLASASAEWMALCQPHTTAELIRHSASGPSPRIFSLSLTRARSRSVSTSLVFYFSSLLPLPFDEHT